MRTVTLASKWSSLAAQGPQLQAQHVDDVVLLVRLENVVLQVGRALAYLRIHDLVLDVRMSGQPLDDLVDQLPLCG